MTASRNGEIRRGAMFAAETDVEMASANLETLEWLSARRRRRTVEDNRPAIARSLGVGVTAIERIRHKRRKVIPSWVMAAIRTKLIVTLQQEIAELEHEIDIAHHLGVREDVYLQAAVALQNARAILEKAVRPG